MICVALVIVDSFRSCSTKKALEQENEVFYRGNWKRKKFDRGSVLFPPKIEVRRAPIDFNRTLFKNYAYWTGGDDQFAISVVEYQLTKFITYSAEENLNLFLEPIKKMPEDRENVELFNLNIRTEEPNFSLESVSARATVRINEIDHMLRVKLYTDGQYCFGLMVLADYDDVRMGFLFRMFDEILIEQ